MTVTRFSTGVQRENFLTTNYAYGGIPTGRVAYYPGTLSSGNLVNSLGSNGTGTSLSQVTGYTGNAVSFNGSAYCNLNFSSNPSAMTWAFWMKAAMPSAQGSILNNVSYFAQSITDFPFSAVTGTDGRVYWSLSNGNDFTADLTLSTNSVVCDNSWHFIAITYTANSSAKLYVDSNLSASSTISFALSTSSQNWFLGRDALPNGGGAPGRFYVGSLEEVSYYTKELSATEVRSLMLAGGS